MVEEALIKAIYTGWYDYQRLLVQALKPLDAAALGTRPVQDLRSVEEIATHIIGARARWFHMLLGEGGEIFAELGQWDRPGMPERSAAEIVDALETTWRGMQAAIQRWTVEQWGQTYQGEGPDEPQVITRYWVIWHLIEHDVHHGGEISMMLGMHGVPGVNL